MPSRHLIGALELLAFLAFFGFWIYVLIWMLQINRAVSRILSAHQKDIPTLETINDLVTSLNQESTRLTFTPMRRANILFRGRIVSIVDGYVGGIDTYGFVVRWTSNRLLFAVADLEQSEWMSRNSDVFTLAFKGTTGCVFWTNVLRLKA